MMDQIESESESIHRAADLMSAAIAKDELIHVIGSDGHSNMGAYELFCRAGGLAAVSAILDPGPLMSMGARRSTIIERTPRYARAVLDAFDVHSGVLAIVNAYGINAMKHHPAHHHGRPDMDPAQGLSTASIVRFVVLGAVLIFVVAPFAFTLTASLMPARDIIGMPYPWIPKDLYVRNFVKAIAGKDKSYVFVACTVSVTTVLLASLTGYSLFADEFIDAARVDGMGELAIYRKIVLPNTGPAIATLSILAFGSQWDTLLWPLLIAQTETMKTLPLYIVKFTGDINSGEGSPDGGGASCQHPHGHPLLLDVEVLYQRLGPSFFEERLRSGTWVSSSTWGTCCLSRWTWCLP